MTDQETKDIAEIRREVELVRQRCEAMDAKLCNVCKALMGDVSNPSAEGLIPKVNRLHAEHEKRSKQMWAVFVAAVGAILASVGNYLTR